MKIYIFKTIEKSLDGRPYLISFPKDKIDKIESIYGGEEVELKVNGIEVEGSFNDLVKDFTPPNSKC